MTRDTQRGAGLVVGPRAATVALDPDVDGHVCCETMIDEARGEGGL